MADNKKLFQWSGISAQGNRVQGTLKAIDAKDAQAELKRQSIEVVSIKIKTEIAFFKPRNKVKLKNILLFTRYLSTMLAAGLPILQALDIISQDQDNLVMQEFVLALRSNISSGKTLAESFKQYPEYFSELYCNLISAGEKSGTLDKTLKRLGIYLERTENLRSKIKKALIYPAAIISVALIASSVLLIFVVPKFETMFKSFGATLPMFTRLVLVLSRFMQGYWWLIIICGFVGVWLFKRTFRSSETFRRRVDKVLLNFFVIGPILRKGIIARFTRTLSTTLDAGMPITDALKSMINIMGNQIYSEAIVKISLDVTSGHPLNVSLTKTKLFPAMAIQMISVGEASGSLGEMLNKIAEYYEEEVNNVVDNLSSLLEPLIMCVLGLVVGGLIIAMYLPIFKMGSLF